MFRLTMAMCVFLMLQCGYLRAQSGGGQSEFCLKNYNRDCPAEPADCGTIPCTRPSGQLHVSRMNNQRVASQSRSYPSHIAYVCFELHP